MKIVVLDSNYLCYRALHTTGGLSYKNIKTGVIYGFLNQLLTIAGQTRPDSVVFAWDSRQSKRREICPSYKNRKHRSDPVEAEEMRDVFKQFRTLRKEVIPNIGFDDIFKFRGLEADDIIAQMVMDERYKDHEFTVVTGDDDLLQLLDYCRIYHPMKLEWKDRDWFIKSYGIVPQKWTMVKQMAGCTSDNVKGISGVGEKKAIQYLTGKMSPNSKIYSRIESKESQFIINRNKELVCLPFKGTPKVDLSESEVRVHMRRLRRICKELGIRTLISPDKHDEWEAYLNGE